MIKTIRKIKKGFIIFISLNVYIRNIILELFKKEKTESQKGKCLDTNFNDQTAQELCSSIEQYCNQFDISGLQVSVINNKKYFHFSTGEADLESTFYLASLSKLYTKAVILKLTEEGIISLEDTIDKYIDIFPHEKSIKIKHLLNHTSGLPEFLKNWKLFKSYFLGESWDYDKVINTIKKKKPLFEPGDRYCYSNTGFVLLGAIAEKATKKTFSDLLEYYFLEGFNLFNTYYSAQDELPKNIVTGYDKEIYNLGKIGLKANVEKFPVNLPLLGLTAGGILANSSDVCNFLYKIIESDNLNKESKRKLRLFFNLNNYDSDTLRTHSGIIVGYTNYLAYSNSKNYYIAILTNLTNGNLDVLEKITDKIVTAVNNEL